MQPLLFLDLSSNKVFAQLPAQIRMGGLSAPAQTHFGRASTCVSTKTICAVKQSVQLEQILVMARILPAGKTKSFLLVRTKQFALNLFLSDQFGFLDPKEF